MQFEYTQTQKENIDQNSEDKLGIAQTGGSQNCGNGSNGMAKPGTGNAKGNVECNRPTPKIRYKRGKAISCYQRKPLCFSPLSLYGSCQSNFLVLHGLNTQGDL